MSTEQLLDKYTKALGGKENVDNIKTLTVNGKVQFEVQGEVMSGTLIEKNALPNKQYRMIDLSVMQQATWYDGNKAWMKANTTLVQAEKSDLDKITQQAGIIPEAKLIENGYKCEVLGKQKGFIVLKATKNELSTVYYFDENSYLLVKKESTDQMPEGVIPITDTYSNWKEFGGVKFPTTAQTDTPLYSIKYELDYKTNELIDDSAFAPAK